MNDIKNRVIELDINDVLPNRFQPRVKFNEEAIIELAESIKEHGIIQPIIVRPIGDKYEIIAGERRYKASILAGKETIPAIITDLNDKDSAEIALIENVQRKNLTPIEEAVSYKKILDMGYLTQEQLALKLGRSQSSIANKMRLLNLSDDVQEALIEEKISERHARSLLKLNTYEKQNQMLDRIIEERLTVRKTDEEIEKMNNGMSSVVEPKSEINLGAFNNDNPGFVDINKIENQAQELKTETPKVDINALLMADSKMTNNPQPQSKPSSIFNFFSKPENKEPIKEELKPTIEPTIEDKKEEPVYTFQPLPKELNEMDDYNSINQMTQFQTPINSFSSMTNDGIKETQTLSADIPVSEDKFISSIPFVETKPLESSIPAIDLSNFQPVSNLIVEQNEKPLEPETKSIGEPSLSSPVTTPIFTDIVFDDEGYVINAKPAAVKATEDVQVKPLEPAIKPIETITIEEELKPTPIIVTDYEKQFDPINLNVVHKEIKPKMEFKQVLSSIRETTSTIEKEGYKVDTDEIDLGTEYRIIITIEK